MENSITVTRAEEINHLHRIINESMKSVIEKQKINFMEIGRLLQDQKAELGHGNFAKWINENCNFSYRTARAYIQAYRQNGNAANLEDMSLRKAIEGNESSVFDKIELIRKLMNDSKKTIGQKFESERETKSLENLALIIKTFKEIKLQGHPEFESHQEAVDYYNSMIAIGNEITQGAKDIYDDSDRNVSELKELQLANGDKN